MFDISSIEFREKSVKHLEPGDVVVVEKYSVFRYPGFVINPIDYDCGMLLYTILETYCSDESNTNIMFLTDKCRIYKIRLTHSQSAKIVFRLIR